MRLTTSSYVIVLTSWHSQFMTSHNDYVIEHYDVMAFWFCEKKWRHIIIAITSYHERYDVMPVWHSQFSWRHNTIIDDITEMVMSQCCYAISSRGHTPNKKLWSRNFSQSLPCWSRNFSISRVLISKFLNHHLLIEKFRDQYPTDWEISRSPYWLRNYHRRHIWHFAPLILIAFLAQYLENIA